MLKFVQTALLWLVPEVCQMSTSARVVSKWLHQSPLDKQTAGCNSPHNRLMRLAMDVEICGAENGTNGFHFAIISVDVVFGLHYVATPPPRRLPPYTRSASGIGYASKTT